MSPQTRHERWLGWWESGSAETIIDAEDELEKGHVVVFLPLDMTVEQGREWLCSGKDVTMVDRLSIRVAWATEPTPGDTGETPQ